MSKIHPQARTVTPAIFSLTESSVPIKTARLAQSTIKELQ